MPNYEIMIAVKDTQTLFLHWLLYKELKKREYKSKTFCMLQSKIEHSVFLCDFLDRKLVILLRGILQGHALRMRGARFLSPLSKVYQYLGLGHLKCRPFFTSDQKWNKVLCFKV